MNDKTTPAILGGIFIGITGALPVINLLNCFCCGLVIAGGIIASRSLVQGSSVRINTGDGALVGLMAGAIGAGVGTILNIPIQILMATYGLWIMERLIDTLNTLQLPPGSEDTLREMLTRKPTLATILIGFLFSLVIYGIFATIGGMLGVKIFEKRPPGMPPSHGMPPPQFHDPTVPPPLPPPSIDRF